MPEKEGAEEKSTKSVVNKKQKQMMGEEGYDIARDEGRVKPSKDKKDATSYPVSDEVKKTQKKNKGPSALELVKKKYGKAVMKVGKKKVKEELDLTKVAEAFGGYIIEAKKGRKPKDYLTGRISLTGNIPPEERQVQPDADEVADKRVNQAKKSGKIDDFTSKPIEGAPDTKKLVRGKKGETIANPVTTSKKTAEKKARVSTAGTGGKKVKNETQFSKETDLEDAIKGKTKTPLTTSTKKPVTKTKVKTPTPKVTGGADRKTDVTNPPEQKKLDPRKAPTKRVDLRTVKRKISRKARLPVGMTRQDKIEIEKKKVTEKEPKMFLGKRITKKGFKGVVQQVKQARKVTKKTATEVGKGAVKKTKAFGKFAIKNPFAAAIVGTEVLDRVGGMLPKPSLPKMDVGVVGRRTAG